MAGTPTPTKAPAPGSLFGIPGPAMSTSRRAVPDAANGIITTTLSQTSQVQATTTTLDRLDILKDLLVSISIAETYTPGSGKTITQSPLFPYNFVTELSVQFESAFKTMRLPGFLAAIMQQYRPTKGAKSTGMLFNEGVNWQQGAQITSTYAKTAAQASLTGASITNATTPVPLLFEVPLAFQFDQYYEISLEGQPLAAIPRAIVSPQYMSGTTRNVRPQITFSPGFLVGTGGQALNAPATIASGDTLSTFAGTATTQIFRDGWFASNTLAQVPPIYMWQYSRDYIAYPTSGSTAFAIPLDTNPVGQGQVLSLVFGVWDPALNSGAGGWAATTNLTTVELLKGSTLQQFNDTPQINNARWGAKHATLLPQGFLGWDLALTDDGLLTNGGENVLNTLTTSGCQVRLTYNTGSAPSSTSTIYIGLEMLKAVTS